MRGRAKFLDDDLQQPRSWSRIGRAYQAHESRMNWAEFGETLERVNEIYKAAQRGISYAETTKMISRDEKLSAMSDLQRSPVGRLVKALNVLVFHTASRVRSQQILRSAARQENLPDNALLGGELADRELGRRIVEEVDRCFQCLEDTTKSSTKDVLLKIVLKLASNAMDRILVQFRTNRILDQCAYCHRAMFPTTPRKRYCSADCEDKDCGHRHRSQQFYHKVRKSGGRMSRAEAARLAAKARWSPKRLNDGK
jgi:hypothetical protein